MNPAPRIFAVPISSGKRRDSIWRPAKIAALALAAILVAGEVSAQTGSYNVTLNPGYNLIANQFTNPSVSINVVLTNIPGLPNNATFVEWNNSLQSFSTTSTYTAPGSGGPIWMVPAGPSNLPLPPGQGGFLFNPGAAAVTATFSGTPNSPALPLSLTPQFLYLLSRQTNGTGTFKNITGLDPSDGDQLFRFNGGSVVAPLQPPQYTAYAYCAGSWFPDTPVASVGEAVWIVLPQFINECITLQNPGNISATSYDGLPVDVEFETPNATDTCDTNAITVICSPPSGTIFPIGTTPIHCVAVDVNGLAASCDFTVTVSPLPPQPITGNYSVNILTGYNLIANQLISGGNTVGEVLADVPDGCVVYKFNNTLQQWIRSAYSAQIGAWDPPDVTLAPGDGAFFLSPMDFQLNFFGAPNASNSPVSIPQGQAYLLSGQTNDTADYKQIAGSGPPNGATVYKFDPANQVYDTFTFTGGVWSPFKPVANIGESMWLAPSGGAPLGIPLAPVITQQPTNQTVALGQAAAFSVIASGAAPLFYQWMLNENPIIGATNSSYSLQTVSQPNAGNYNVLVYNSIGSVLSQTVTLGINSFQPFMFPPYFSNAVSLVSLQNAFTITGNNLGAVSEPGTPTIAGFKGGSSVWATWKPHDINGIYTLSMAGSSFDTLLGVYTGTNINNLTPVASDDDSAGFLCSQVSFNATVGPTYYFQIDGFYGQSGDFVLSLNRTGDSAQIIPEITLQPQSQAAPLGAPVTLSAQVQPAGTTFIYQWFQNGGAISGATSSNYVIAGLGPKNVGNYQVQVTNPQFAGSVLSGLVSVELLNTLATGIPGNPDVRAADKFLAETDITDPAPATGFSGSQVFSTIGATSDPGEPSHCGVAPCASQWSSYLPPDNGLLTISTAGTAFDNVLEAYTGPGDSFATLVPVACSNTNHAAGGEVIQFEASAGTIYWVVVSGVSCASGNVTLSYSLLSPPSFLTYPSGQSVTNGATVTLSATLNGTTPFNYQWMQNGTNVPGAAGTSVPLTINNFQAANQGSYSLRVSNSAGSVTSPAAPVYLNNPFFLANNQKTSGSFASLLVGKPNTKYAIQISTNLIDWVSIQTNNSYSSGLINFIDYPDAGVSNRFYRGELQ